MKLSRSLIDLKRKPGKNIKPAKLEDYNKCDCGRIICNTELKCMQCKLNSFEGLIK